MTTAVQRSFNMSVPWYLMACYAYYEMDEPMLTDQAFDHLAKEMVTRWESIEHRHKDCLTEDILRASTAPNRYPEMAVGACRSLIEVLRRQAKKPRQGRAAKTSS